MSSQRPEMRAEFDRFADEYEHLHRQNIWITGEGPDYFSSYKIAEFAGFVGDLNRQGTKILDFGAGIGNSIPFFRKFFPLAELTCADPSARSLELSRSRFPGAERYTVLTETAIPHEAGAFDLAFSACVFHHIASDEHRRWLEELHRVTRPGGLLTIFEHNPLNPLTVQAVNTCPFDENAVLIGASALRRTLEEAGWRDPVARYHVFFPRALAALRPFEKHLAGLPLGGQYSMTAHRS